MGVLPNKLRLGLYADDNKGQQGKGMKKKILTLVSILVLVSVSCIAGLRAVKADNNIAINYTYYYQAGGTNNIIFNMTIKNNGNSPFYVFYADFTMNESGDQYPSTSLTAIPYLDTLPTVTLNSGGTCSGALVYYGDPSVSNAQYTMSYFSVGTTPNIVWNGQVSTTSNSSPTPTVTPTSTTEASPATPEFPTTAILAAFLGLTLLAATMLTIRKRRISKSK